MWTLAENSDTGVNMFNHVCGWGGAQDGQILSVPLTPTTPRNVTVIE